MVAAGTARDGMVAKLNAALAAVDGGVASVRIIDGRQAKYADGAGTTVGVMEAAVMEAIK
jgi:acetylglutamate kinase